MLVNAKYGHTTKKVLQRPFVIFRFARIVNTLVEFCEGDDREGETFLPLEFSQALHNTLVIVKVMDRPIRINEVLDRHSRG